MTTPTCDDPVGDTDRASLPTANDTNVRVVDPGSVHFDHVIGPVLQDLHQAQVGRGVVNAGESHKHHHT